jgi:hypothetical protein
METANTSETSLNFYKTTRRNNPEDNHFHTRRRENLKSYEEGFFLISKIRTRNVESEIKQGM